MKTGFQIDRQSTLKILKERMWEGELAENRCAGFQRKVTHRKQKSAASEYYLRSES